MNILDNANRISTFFTIGEAHPAALDLEIKAFYLQGLCFFSVVDNDIDAREKHFIGILSEAFGIKRTEIDGMLSIVEDKKDVLLDLAYILKENRLELVFLVDAFLVVLADRRTRIQENEFLHSMRRCLGWSEGEYRLYGSAARILFARDPFDSNDYIHLMNHAYKRSMARKSGNSDKFETLVGELGYSQERLKSELVPGMKLNGVVTGIEEEGVFVDIGFRRDGLVHIGQLPDQDAQDIRSETSVGQKVEVTVLDMDDRNGRVSLSMKPNPFGKAKKGYVYYCNTGRTFDLEGREIKLK